MSHRWSRLLSLLLVLTLVLCACSKEKSAEEYFQDGQAYLESGDVSKAISALEEALKQDPGMAKAHRLLGEALGRNEQWSEAITEFEAYQSLAQEDSVAYFLLGHAYAQVGQLEEASAAFARGSEVDPSFLDTHQEEIAQVIDSIVQAGQAALDAGDLETATGLLNLIAPLAPGQGQVYVLLGEAHLQANDTLQALDAFANAVRLSPELLTERAQEFQALAGSGLEMGRTAFESGDLETAIQVMRAVVELMPENVQAHFMLGNAYNQANQLNQAIEAYESVLDLNPDSASALTNMGVVYYKLGQLDTAIQKYNAALQIEPDDPETHYLLGAAYVQMDQLEQGQSEFETALNLDEQLAPAYIGLGNVYLLQGKMDAALDTLEQAIELAPNSPEAYFALGQTYMQAGNTEKARAALERVLELNPAPRWREQVELMLESLDSP